MPIISGGQVMPGATARGAVARATATYSFARDGGAVGTINLPGDVVPSGSTVLGGYIDVTTVLTSAGAATAGAQVEAAGDLQPAVVVTGAPWSTTGRKSITPAFTGATSLRTTADRSIALAVGTAALTAGAFTVVLFYQPA